MFSQTCLGTVLLLNVVAAPAPLQPGLRWRLKEGDVVYHQSESSVQQSMTIMGMKVDQKQERSTLTRYVVKRKNADGSLILEQTIVSLKGKGGVAEAGIGDKIQGSSFLVTLNARGEVVKLDGYKQFLARVGTDEATRALVATSYSEDTFKYEVNEVFACLAGKSVNVGDTWRRRYLLAMGPLGSFTGERTYQYAGKTTSGKHLDRIDWTSRVRYSPPQRGQAAAAVPFRIDKATFTADEVKGTIYFDAATGRLVEMSSTARLKGKMKIVIGEQLTEIEMDSTGQEKARLLDKAP